MTALFQNRKQAGRVLAEKLQQYAARPDALVVALPRGGVPVGFEVAQALHLPLKVLVVRKLGFPGQEELAFGALASGERVVLNEEVAARITSGLQQTILARAQRELTQREQLYQDHLAHGSLRGWTVLVIDDGIATGASIRAALVALRSDQPTRLIAAVPVAAVESCEALLKFADEVVCAATPHPFFGVGAWYEDFSQTEDEEVRALLEQAARHYKSGRRADRW